MSEIGLPQQSRKNAKLFAQKGSKFLCFILLHMEGGALAPSFVQDCGAFTISATHLVLFLNPVAYCFVVVGVVVDRVESFNASDVNIVENAAVFLLFAVHYSKPNSVPYKLFS